MMMTMIVMIRITKNPHQTPKRDAWIPTYLHLRIFEGISRLSGSLVMSCFWWRYLFLGGIWGIWSNAIPFSILGSSNKHQCLHHNLTLDPLEAPDIVVAQPDPQIWFGEWYPYKKYIFKWSMLSRFCWPISDTHETTQCTIMWKSFKMTLHLLHLHSLMPPIWQI